MKDLTKGKESRLIFNFALPMLLGNIFQQFYNITDSIIVGNYIGKEALAAVGASFPIIFTLISLIIGISSGFTIIISQFFGAKEMNNVSKTIDTMNIFLFISSIILTILGLLIIEPLFSLLQLPLDVLPDAVAYLQIYFLGLIAFFGFNGVSAILRGLGDSKTPFYFLIFSTILNIGFDLLFILVFKWGIKGAAIATVLAQFISLITIIFYLNVTKNFVRISFINLKFSKPIFIKSLKIGLPSGFQHTFVSVGMMALLGIVNGFGTDVLAAYTIVGRIDSLSALPAMNFSAALTTFVGQNLGANQILRVKKGLYSTLIMTSIISLFVSIIVIVFGKELISVFSQDSNVIEIGESYLIIVCSFYIIFSSMFTFNGVMRGAGDTIIPMFITLFALWIIRIPLAYLLSDKIGYFGIWWSIPIAWIFGMTLSIAYYKFGNWKSKVIIKYY